MTASKYGIGFGESFMNQVRYTRYPCNSKSHKGNRKKSSTKYQKIVRNNDNLTVLTKIIDNYQEFNIYGKTIFFTIV
jgi:hypothetical protein